MNGIVGRHNVARAVASVWCYDFALCPHGAKVLLLTEGGIAILGHVNAESKGYIAWAPLPDRNREKEAEIARSKGVPYL